MRAPLRSPSFVALAALLLACAPVSAQPDDAAPPPPPAPPPVPDPAPTPPRAPTVLWKVPIKSTSFGAGAIADVDADGKLDVAFGTYFGDGTIRVLRGRDGSVIWQYTPEVDCCIDASMKFADVDADGKLELIAPISNLSRVMAFDAATGRIKWIRKLPPAECIDTPPWIGPMKGLTADAKVHDVDNATAIVVGTFAGNLHVLDGRDGTVVRTLKVAPGAVQSCPIITDLDTDGIPDFIAANFNGDHKIHAVSGRDGDELWNVATGSHIYHGPAMGDLDADGFPEFVIGSYDATVYAFARDGRVLWTVKPGDRYFMAPITLVDLEGDARPEAVSTSQRITAIRPDGTIMWSVPADETNGMDSTTRGVSVADLDDDAYPDLAYLTGAGLFRVLRGRDGVVLYELDVAKAVGIKCDQSSHGPIIADLDADGRLDVFLVIGNTAKETKAGMAVCLTGFAGRRTRGEGWRMMRHDLQNTGNAATPPPGPPK